MTDNPPPEDKKLHSLNYNSKPKMRRKRTVFTKEQIKIFKKSFQSNLYPGFEEREELSKMTGIPESRIQVWFQNRRSRQHAPQKGTSEASTSLREMCLEDVSPSPILEEHISEQEHTILSASRCPSWAGEPSQEAGPRSGCSFERRSAALVTEAAGLCGHGISQSHHFDSSQTQKGPSTKIQPCVLPRPMTQGGFSHWASSWAWQGTQGSEKYNTHSSFYGGLEPPQHIQEQGWTMEQIYSNHSSISGCAEEPPQQLQQPHPQQNYPQQPQQNCSHQPHFQHPSTLQSLVPQASTFQGQQSQELQDQTLPPPRLKRERSCESFFSFNQQELHCMEVSERILGLGSTLPLPDGHLTVPQGPYAPQEHLPVPQRYWANPLGNQDDTLTDLADHQRHLTDTEGQLPTHPETSG